MRAMKCRIAGEAFNVGHVERATHAYRTAAVAASRPARDDGARQDRCGREVAGPRNPLREYLDLPPYSVNLDKARRVLGTTPTPIEAAFRHGFDWYQSQPRRPIDYAWEDRILAPA